MYKPGIGIQLQYAQSRDMQITLVSWIQAVWSRSLFSVHVHDDKKEKNKNKKAEWHP